MTEAAMVDGLNVYDVENLKQTVEILNNKSEKNLSHLTQKNFLRKNKNILSTMQMLKDKKM